MMEQRRALTIPFAVDKDNLMESPFRIPMTCVSPESGKLEKQVSWTEFSGRKCRHDSRHRNGSILFGHNLASKFMLEMDRRKPRLILTDILKTEQGKAYLEKTKRKHTLRNRGQVSSNLKELSGCMESSLNCSETRSRPRVARNAKNSCSAKDSKRTSSSTPQRSGFRTRSQRNQDVDEEEKDMKEVMLGTEKDYRFAEVVDCGLSVSWEPADDKDSCDEFSPVCMKEKWTDPDEDLQDSLKNKRKITRSQCNGTNSPKRFRESVLRLTRDDGRDGELVCSPDYLEEFREDPESLDRNILQFTVGGDPADVHVNVTSANLETGDFLGTCRQSLSSSQDNTTTTGHSEPIVLSSDDESCDITQHLSPVVHSIVAVEETLIQEEGAKPQEPSDIENMQMVPVAVEDLPPEAMSLFSKVEYNSMGVAFSAIYYGAHQGRSNGELLFKDQKIIIPLKDLSEQVDMVLTIGPNQLGRYSIWDQQDLETQAVQIKCDVEPVPPSILLLYVSASAAAVVQQNFVKVFGEHTEATDTDMVSQFILLTLQHPVEGMNGALLRSLLDIYCLNSIANDSFSSVDGLEDFGSPVLSLDDSIDLIKTTGLDSNLLSLLGLKDFDFELKTDQYSPHSDTERSVTPPIQPEDDSQPEAILEVETETEGVSSPPLKPEEDHKDQETEDPHEKRKEEPSPAYTICHRRTKASYCVSMCKPDASWTKYKHKGLAHRSFCPPVLRLIQFPPPPMKGGITVTMEDLQCLDSGQFLNDVIIDFYLKYLLHKASAAVTERSHIFSSFFYKQLTRRDNASEGNMKDSCQRQRRHQRVKTWTRHVDIFNKDFLFVPVNQEAHWYLVVICFPGLDEPTLEGRNDPNSQVVKILSRTGELQEQEATQGNESPNDNTETPQTPPLLNHNDHVDTETENTQESNKDSKPGPVSCTEQTFQKKIICKRPCILVMDSLKRSLHERVFKLLRDYLESEWEVRRGSSRDFNAEHMQSSHCKVPLQDNSSDCGLYLLQYVESFLKDPVVHFDLPLQLQRWFPRQQVRRKRDEIRNLVLNLYRRQNLDNNR
ncbi:sentrin-specific protease 7 isoform X2 [Antennarius striatus]|uniref:sentrin-specific protease 7 isoform X2 n=1 Tax=Antennarius striatus TaxID=241820 RepID=UPI0035AED275